MNKPTKIILAIVATIIGIQLIPVDRKNPPVIEGKNFITIENTPTEISTMIRNSCYDCHSNEVRYPWYSYVAPFSWSIKNHINEGKKYLNFSEWGDYNNDIKIVAMQKSADEILENKMPLSGYLPLHPEAKLTTEQKIMLANYFQKIATQAK